MVGKSQSKSKRLIKKNKKSLWVKTLHQIKIYMNPTSLYYMKGSLLAPPNILSLSLSLFSLPKGDR
jgi:hypothetical protein